MITALGFIMKGLSFASLGAIFRGLICMRGVTRFHRYQDDDANHWLLTLYYIFDPVAKKADSY